MTGPVEGQNGIVLILGNFFFGKPGNIRLILIAAKTMGTDNHPFKRTGMPLMKQAASYTVPLFIN